MRQLLGLFRSRNYRLYFSGQFISQIGNWMTQTATLWLVYQLTQSVFLVGVIGFATQIPTLLVAPVAGVWVDRLDRVRLLVVTQSLAALQSLALAAAVFGHFATFFVLVNLALIQGAINAFDIPARQVLNGTLPERREDLAGIISLNSTLVNLGRMVGPAVAGFVIAGAGAGFCFLLDAASYLAGIATVLALRLERSARPRGKGSVRRELGEGFALALRDQHLWLLLLVAAAVSVFGLSVFTLLPSYAKEVFGGEGRTLGLLMSSFSGGAAFSGIVLAGRRGRADWGQVIFRGLVLAGATLVAFAFSRSLALSIGCLFFMGAGCVMVVASSNTLVQHLVTEDKRGRILSLYGVAFQGGMPLGALLTGTLAQHLGLRGTSLLNGFASLALALVLLSRLFELDADPRTALGEAPPAP